jgi:sugar phosphate isomerase/epimerase
MILGYNTNGFAHHRLEDCVEILAELGYRAIALTPDVHHLESSLDPSSDQAKRWGEKLQSLGLAVAVETGSRFLLDPRRKHQPTLLSPDEADRRKRFDFLTASMRAAHDLHATCVSFWSGTSLSEESPSVLMDRLVEECRKLCDVASAQSVRIAFEPEPGMFIDTMAKFAELHGRVNHPSFGLTLDLGHLVCQREGPIGAVIRTWKDWLWNVHLDDMKPDVHDHLMFGEGVVDFADAFSALRDIGFRDIASVELSRHSYDAVNAAKKAMQFLALKFVAS